MDATRRAEGVQWHPGNRPVVEFNGHASSSMLDFIREGLLAHFSFPFWLHIMIGQFIVCSKKRAKADWLMTCAKADWLRTNVMIFSCYLIG